MPMLYDLFASLTTVVEITRLERHQWLEPLTMDEILADIKQRQKISE